MRRIDLHTHSIYSDGSMTPEELVAHAAAKGLSAIALTDHDTVRGIPFALVAGKEYGVEIVPGVEVSTECHVQVHMLGFYVDTSNKPLLDAFAAMQEERKENHKAYMKKLNEMGFIMTEEDVRAVAPVGGIGRAHYAKVMMNKGYVESVAEAFRIYLGVGCPCYIKRNVMTPEEAIALIHGAGGLAFFAHPHQTKLSDDGIFGLMTTLKEAGLDGIEGYYSEYTPEMGGKFRDMAEKLDLMLCGGSDYHAQMKPHIEIGEGINGNLTVDGILLDRIKEKIRKQHLSIDK